MQKPSLVIIDDEIEITNVVGNVGRRLGYDVRAATDMNCFVDTISDYVGADTIVIDIVMPEYDGIEIMEILAAYGCKSKIILMSGKHPQYVEMAKKLAIVKGLNIVGKLMKPFGTDELREALRPEIKLVEQVKTG